MDSGTNRSRYQSTAETPAYSNYLSKSFVDAGTGNTSTNGNTSLYLNASAGVGTGIGGGLNTSTLTPAKKKKRSGALQPSELDELVRQNQQRFHKLDVSIMQLGEALKDCESQNQTMNENISKLDDFLKEQKEQWRELTAARMDTF
eukprot:TRINITY_DN7621_c0_g1_i2.p1 TRINITY_DN7621_c0_g1~~TRINITY_DN7621_c0_g1_i2.p1  ORF type:complete len:146 (-),score=51.08 TRINITY_DN7621_c0_g1_i2:99-536(-)